MEAFIPTDLAMTGVDPSSVSSGEGYVTAAVGPNRAFAAVVRNDSTLTWSTIGPTTAPQNVVSLQTIPLAAGFGTTVIEQADAGISLVRHDVNGRSVLGISAAPVAGFDSATFGGAAYIAYGLNGDLRLVRIGGTALGGSGAATNFGGPPRTGFSAPYPVMLDVNPLCEAAYPRMAFVEDALVIAWQERCAPETRWTVMARAIR